MEQARFFGFALTHRASQSSALHTPRLTHLMCIAIVAVFLTWARVRFKSSESAQATPFFGSTRPIEADRQPTNDNVVILTAVNFAFREHLANMRCSLVRIGIADQLRVVALDEEVAKWAQNAGFTVVGTAHEAAKIADGHEGELKFDSSAFNLLTKFKISAVYDALAEGYDVLFTDADMFWCADALKEITTRVRNSGEHMVIQSAWPRALLNSGFYFVRTGNNSRQLFEELLQHPGDAENDQVIFNRVLCSPTMGGKVVHGENDYNVRHTPDRSPKGCTRGGVTVGLLDRGRYPTGGEVFDGKKIFHYPRQILQGWCARTKVAIFHNNCIMGIQKRARFVVKGFWYVDADGVSCLSNPAPMTKAAVKRCGMPKCGREDLDNFYTALKRVRLQYGTNGTVEKLHNFVEG